MGVSESHTIKIEGRITLKDLEDLVARARAAGGQDNASVRPFQGGGHQRDETPASITVIIAGSSIL